ncbi:MAG: hypothetical protein ABI557_00650 [Aureliella sp.]
MRHPKPIRLARFVRKLPVFAVLLAVGLSSSMAHAQLSVLSEGNKPAKWKASQAAALQQQLADPKLADELKLELQSQLKWLNAWEPGKLTDAPLWTTEADAEPWEEPSLDPQGLAGELRERLFGTEASPTVEDTAELKRLLAEHDSDLGVRQLHLHWLDQVQYRKLYSQEIAEAAAKVLALLDGVAKPDQKTATARVFTLYRRGRALAYRELPESLANKPMDEAELAKNEADLVGVYYQLKKLAAEPRPEFVLLEDRMLRRDHWNGRALALLEDFGGQVALQWFLKKRRDILRELDWESPAKEAAAIYASAFPDEVAREMVASESE